MIIENVRIKPEHDWTKIIATITIENDLGYEYPTDLYFAVQKKDEMFLDDSFADNFVLALLLIAVSNDENIEVRGSYVSKELIYNLENIMIPKLAIMNCGTGKTKIIAESSTQHRGESACTGISMGIDSFYSVIKHKDDENFPVRMLLFAKLLETELIEISELVKSEFDERQKVADGFNMHFLPMVSNLAPFMKKFVFANYYPFFFLALALTIKEINCYYFASSFKEQKTLNFSDAAYYGDYIQECMNYGEFKMFCSGVGIRRFDKSDYIKNESIVKKHLDVCSLENKILTGKKNCSECTKCIRTMTTLDVQGCLNEYGTVFDLDKYYKNKARFWGEVEYRKRIMHEEFANETINEAKLKKYKIPKNRWLYFLKIGIKNQIVKIKGRILE